MPRVYVCVCVCVCVLREQHGDNICRIDLDQSCNTTDLGHDHFHEVLTNDCEQVERQDTSSITAIMPSPV